jgi:NAD(P)H-dependent flavin oxidoreductase YrpB (nitropropane dioxygenase family)
MSVSIKELLKLELPIIQAPMAGVQGSALTIAVSNAGGLGALRWPPITQSTVSMQIQFQQEHGVIHLAPRRLKYSSCASLARLVKSLHFHLPQPQSVHCVARPRPRGWVIFHHYGPGKTPAVVARYPRRN